MKWTIAMTKAELLRKTIYERAIAIRITNNERAKVVSTKSLEHAANIPPVNHLLRYYGKKKNGRPIPFPLSDELLSFIASKPLIVRIFILQHLRQRWMSCLFEVVYYPL